MKNIDPLVSKLLSYMDLLNLENIKLINDFNFLNEMGFVNLNPNFLKDKDKIIIRIYKKKLFSGSSHVRSISLSEKDYSKNIFLGEHREIYLLLLLEVFLKNEIIIKKNKFEFDLIIEKTTIGNTTIANSVNLDKNSFCDYMVRFYTNFSLLLNNFSDQLIKEFILIEECQTRIDSKSILNDSKVRINEIVKIVLKDAYDLSKKDNKNKTLEYNYLENKSKDFEKELTREKEQYIKFKKSNFLN